MTLLNREKETVFSFCEDYKKFISTAKTERECTDLGVQIAKKHGFKALNEYIQAGKTLKSGDKVYAVNRQKNLALFVIGERPMSEGLNILGAHIDSPRIDLKQNPLYESNGLAFFKTHYYGGIKKYQWVTLPLAIHGVVCKKDNSVISINIGENPEDPVFGFSDLLPHLAQDQMTKLASKVIEGEELNLLVGSLPYAQGEDESVKKAILSILKETYDIEEKDFLSAELEIVPAGCARDYGFDRSLVMGYGHDDRVCAYTSLMAICAMESVEKTACCILVDKEEVGSNGATGMHSDWFKYVVAEIMHLKGEYHEIHLNRLFTNSMMLSSDVSAAYDPTFATVFEKNNSAYLNKGIVFNKYTGARGKAGCNDANPEFMAKIRNVLENEGIAYQTAEIGKVDQGGGGTIAYILANLNVEVIDAGVCVLSMHAPWEIVSKYDVYEAYLAYIAFLKKMK